MPATLSACGGSEPQVVFPSKEPTHASGPGAIVWQAASGCAGGAGARLARVGSGSVPLAGEPLRDAAGRTLQAHGPLLAAGVPHGEIAIAATASHAELIQGRAGGAFRALAVAGGIAAPLAAATAWLGDYALLARSAAPAGPLRLHIERYFAHTFVRSQPVADTGRIGALSVALDYRTDALAAWEHDATLYARELPGRGAPRGVQRIARTGEQVQVASLLSDDYRGILAWSEQQGATTSVYLDQSAVGVRFGAPKLLERFRTPAGPAPRLYSPRLIRLSNESVMLAWPGAAGGRWVVRTAAIDQHGVGAPSTIAAPDADALLCELAAGPQGEAIVLWSELRPGEGAAGLQRQSIFAARGVDARPRRTIFGTPEQLSAASSDGEASVAIDPASDRGLAVWREASGALQYAVRSGGPLG